jgi:catechol 2,3-dioxygenase-like lactoylglutathione lyase family enzyme
MYCAARQIVAIAVLPWLACSAPMPAVAAAPARSVDSISVTVGDMDRSVAFYRDVLSFEPAGDVEVVGEDVEHLYGVFGARVRIVTLKLGSERLKLEQFIAPRGRPIPVDSKSNDRWFQHVAIIVADMDDAFAWLRAHNVEFASTGPQLLPLSNPNAGGIAAFYFRDPDGHNLEILHFPKGKGDPKWQAANGRRFLGIDHSAIVVADTAASLGYYRDLLGLTVAGTSENFGVEQEHLNNVFGARLRITSLRAATGPGVELLEYLAPRTGRPAPVDTLSNDLWNWHVDLSADLDAVDSGARRRHDAYVSPGPVQLHGADPRRTLSLRDPDGHETVVEAR